ncbi:cytochrome P450 [Aspergillus affinis]|uniref:cytochrome P450 n=1 Tax=Aspergillus affinis TaxID=1070780 RepID=UPI0022FEDB16|nr:Cytochrome P450 monooxygenase [Aspergillus affinis]KAI9036030.1 Cytochrome P450 monooxygenase [Aspergillus affinis]
MPSYTPSLVGAATGIGTHVLLYRHGEWDEKAPSILFTYVLLTIFAFAPKWGEGFGLSLPCQWVGYTVFWHILGVYASMLFYRVFLHRLKHFPGPFFAKISNLYATLLAGKKMQFYTETEKLHKRFGDYVRLGPTELSITDPEAIVALHGPQTPVSKGPWYGIFGDRISLQLERDKKIHARRKKVWDRGLNDKSLRLYESRVVKYANQLVDVIEQHVDTSIDMAKWCNYYAFDVMGDLSFGKSFGMLLNSGDTFFLNSLHATMKSVGLLGHLVWLFPFFVSTPILNRENLRFWAGVDAKVKDRMDNEPESPDVFSWLLESYRNGPKTKQDTLNLRTDAFLIVVAGSDTTAATLTNIFFHLATEPDLKKQLQFDLDKLEDFSHQNLTQLDLLDAVINETLRLHPRNFERPTEFLPSRWTTELQLVKNRSVFIPFNSGAYSCVGKRLALMELRCVTAQLLSRYDVSLAPGQSKEAFLEGAHDYFTLTTAPLQLMWRRREGNRTW